MGIKNLNSFLRNNCPESIKCIPLSELSGKKIAVDISIYMYKFHGDGCLIENMYLMMSIFRYYSIIPIFIFDGKPPTEKKELLKKRRLTKQEAEQEYNKLKISLESNDNMDKDEKQEVSANMDILKKQFVYITKELIKTVKDLIVSYGLTYYDAPGEADELCALLAIKKKVWACLSEDMDLFVYGCPRVLRYLSLLKHNIVLYNYKNILVELGLNQQEFREICVLSGTDYNHGCDSDDHCLTKTLKLFKKFYKAVKKNKNVNVNITSGFYPWLLETNESYIPNLDMLNNIYNMFDLSLYHVKNVDNIKIMNGPIIKESLRAILKEDGFLFCK